MEKEALNKVKALVIEKLKQHEMYLQCLKVGP